MTSGEAKAAIDGITLLATGIVWSVLIVGVLLMRDVERNARCRFCEHCRRAADNERDARARKRHENYHAFTDHAPSACQNNECPGRR